jgi:hypothetical protein
MENNGQFQAPITLHLEKTSRYSLRWGPDDLKMSLPNPNRKAHGPTDWANAIQLVETGPEEIQSV